MDVASGPDPHLSSLTSAFEPILGVMSGFDVSLNSQVKFEVSGFGACSRCPSYKYCSGC